MNFNNKIKIIWQTWKNKKIPYAGIDCYKSWKKNTNWDYYLFDDKEIDLFIKSNFKSIYHLFKKLNIGVMKADFWRYCIIYKYGGLYTDIDTQCLLPIDKWIPNNAQIVISPEDNRLNEEYFCQWTFYANKNSSIIKNIIGLMCKRLENFIKKDNYVHYYTGPELFTDGLLLGVKELLLKNGYKKISENITISKLINRDKELELILKKNGIFILPKGFFDGIGVKHLYGGKKLCSDFSNWKFKLNYKY